MSLSYRFRNLTLKSGQNVELQRSGVICIVGANNAGKSRMLKDLVECARSGKTPAQSAPFTSENPKVILDQADLELDEYLPSDLEEWIAENTLPPLYTSPPGTVTLPPTQDSTNVASITGSLNTARIGGGLGSLADFAIRRITAGGSMAYASGPLTTERSPGALQNWLVRKLYGDGGLEQEYSRTIEKLFSEACFVDRSNFPPQLRTGQVTVDAPPVDALTKEYANAVAQRPTLDDQGDGIRSFAGLALVVLALSPSVLLLDEPESFLHPAQARAVGRWLAATSIRLGMQIFVATHDRDFLIGVLNGSTEGEVQVLRLSRERELAKVRSLSSTELNEYWADPTLRYSNVLQGLFHKRVVICEGDADCRFYQAAADEIAQEEDLQHVADNILFVPSSGTGGFAKLLNVLSQLEVERSAIADFDILMNEAQVRNTIESLGSKWDDEIRDAWMNAIRHVPKDAKAFWEKVKHGGLQQVPPGGASTDFKALLEVLAARHLVLVRVGELEDHYREAGKGSEWINAALTAGAHRGSAARALIRSAVPELTSEHSQPA